MAKNLGDSTVVATAASIKIVTPQNKRATIIIYPTVSPESIVIPIVSCIVGFPILALLIICCLRRRARMARERARRRNCDKEHGTLSLVRFSPIHRLAGTHNARPITLKPDRQMSRGFPSQELDTVVEEKSDPEQTQIFQVELMTPDTDTNGTDTTGKES
ncbi:uncharacterized protein LOC113385388 isoform X2 [Ctenocephalides felis]|uniref:uncharacterized protein LOC113385388 isoform X2 n=1 Tax=Ctenocephalides felis TaxID=7515 RepID=UPI000E6E4C61|nr:uncharacterized protein LOC113385388 isoform X2 [Ctenocephalides felis]